MIITFLIIIVLVKLVVDSQDKYMHLPFQNKIKKYFSKEINEDMIKEKTKRKVPIHV